MTLVVMECYEDMFKEITRKLYGEEEIGTVTVEYDSLSTLVSNTIGDEVDDTVTTDDKWIASDETLSWTQSKIASYNASQKLFRCNECESVGFLSRVAEHWLGTHANLRVFQCPQCPYTSAWARCVRMHLARQHNITTEQTDDPMATFWKESPVLEEVTKYLQRLKDKIDGETTPVTTEVVTIKEGEAKELLQQEQTISQTRLHTVIETHSSTGKRYNCNYCSYATDRRDLYTRHENIHREEKPFHCYVCLKQFNRADHVKKHFVRIHRDVCYDLNRIRRDISKDPPPPPPQVTAQTTQTQTQTQPQPQVQAQAEAQIQLQPETQIQLQVVPQVQAATQAPAQDQTTLTSIPTFAIITKPADSNTIIKGEITIPGFQQVRIKPPAEKAPKKKPGEKRYTCSYCSWSGVDNWCLKRHLNTHLKPFVCSLCEYKAARSERLMFHMFKVHNKRACSKCSFLADELSDLKAHQQRQHP